MPPPLDPRLAPGFKARPWWWEEAEPPDRDNVMPDRAAVAIVGGGYAGLSAALTLRRLGHQVVVLDAERIGWGAASRNGGMVSGVLKVAGVEKEIVLPLITTLRSGNMLVLGQIQIDMTDFGITPPTAMMGMLKTDPKVTIKFETTLAKPTT